LQSVAWDKLIDKERVRSIASRHLHVIFDGSSAGVACVADFVPARWSRSGFYQFHHVKLKSVAETQAFFRLIPQKQVKRPDQGGRKDVTS
jgi:hypothetical protein